MTTSYAIKLDTGDGLRTLARVWNIRDAAITARALANAHDAPVTVHHGSEWSRVEPGASIDGSHTRIAIDCVPATA